LTQTWLPDAQFKIECGATTYISDQGDQLEVVLAENNISYAVLPLNDELNKNYINKWSQT